MYNSWTYTLQTRILQLSESMVDAVQEPPGGDFRGDELIRSDATDQGHTAADFPCLASHVELHSSDDCLKNGGQVLDPHNGHNNVLLLVPTPLTASAGQVSQVIWFKNTSEY